MQFFRFEQWKNFLICNSQICNRVQLQKCKNRIDSYNVNEIKQNLKVRKVRKKKHKTKKQCSSKRKQEKKDFKIDMIASYVLL